MRLSRFTPVVLGLVAMSPLVAQQAPKNLADQDLQDLMELLNTPVVSASKTAEKLSEAPATIIVVSKRDIERRGYTQFLEILQDLPGFDISVTQGDTFAKAYARGYRNTIGDSMLIMIDGKVFNHLWYNTTDSVEVAMPLSNIERVEVVYGPASAMYGANAFMGVVNVITSQGAQDSTSLNANLSGGSFSQKGVDLTWKQNKASWGYSLTFRRYEGDLDSKNLDRYEYTNPKWTQGPLGQTLYGNLLNIYGSGPSSPWHTTALDARIWAGKLEFGLQYLTLRSGYGLHYTWDNYLPTSSRWERPEWAFYAKYSTDLTPTLSSTATARYRQSGLTSDSLDWWTGWDSGAKAFFSYPEFWSVKTTSLDVNQDFQWNASKSLSFNFGYVLSQEDQQKGYVHGASDGAWINNSVVTSNDAGPRPILSLSDTAHTSILRRGAYFQAKYRLDDNQTLLAGMRDDWHSAFKEAVTVRGGYVGNWGGLNVKALYGQAYQEPTPRQLFGGWSGSGSSPTLKPQRSWTSELGVGYTTSRWNLMADLYQIRNSSMILTVPGGAQNAGTMDITGLDLHGKLQFPGVLGKELSIWSYWTHNVKAEGSPYNTHVNALNSNDIGDIAKDKIFLGATASFTSDMSLTLKGRHIGSRQVIATNPVGRISAFNVLEAYFQFSNLFVKGLSAGVKVTNLTDAVYFHPGLRDADAGTTAPYYDGSGNYHGSAGYYNSLLPQPSRGFEAVLRYQF
jgi:outer membrane receptor for ferrienterochelin and colicins